jgi:hypothetical protein
MNAALAALLLACVPAEAARKTVTLPTVPALAPSAASAAGAAPPVLAPIKAAAAISNIQAAIPAPAQAPKAASAGGQSGIAQAAAAIAELPAKASAADAHGAGTELETVMTGGASKPAGSAVGAAMSVEFAPAWGFTARPELGRYLTAAPKTLRRHDSRRKAQAARQELNAPMKRLADGTLRFPAERGHKAISDDGTMAAWSDGKRIWIADLVAGVVRDSWDPGAPERIRELKFSGTGRKVAFTYGDPGGVVGVGLLSRAGVEYHAGFHGLENISGMAFSPDGATLAFMTMSGALHVLREGETQARVYGLGQKIYAGRPMAFSGDGKTLAVGLYGKVFLFDVDHADLMPRVLEVDPGPMERVALDHHGVRLAYIYEDEDSGERVVVLRDSLSAKRQLVFLAGQQPIWDLAWRPAGRGVVLATSDGLLRAEVADDGRMSVERYAHKPARWSPRLGPGGESMIAGTRDDRYVDVVPLLPGLWGEASAALEAPVVVEKLPAAPPVSTEASAAKVAAARKFELEKYGIVQEAELLPKLRRWLTDHLEIFRVSARKSLERLAGAGDAEARAILRP